MADSNVTPKRHELCRQSQCYAGYGRQRHNALFNTPNGIAVDSSTNVYVADSSNNLIYRLRPAAWSRPFATSGDGLFNSPEGVAVDGAGNVYVANTGANTILGIPRGGGLTTNIAGAAGLTGSADGLGSAAQFDTPIGLAVDASGNVYVADSLNNTIRKGTPYTAQTAVLTLTTSPSGFPLEVNGTNYASTPQVFAFATGSTNTVTATTNSGYTFINWTQGGTVVSTSSNYTFTLGSNEALVANFLRTLADAVHHSVQWRDVPVWPNSAIASPWSPARISMGRFGRP